MSITSKVIIFSLGIAYLVYSFVSLGFYQHDEIGHYLGALNFWDNPASILSYWARPAFKILYIIPAQLGVIGVHLFTILISLTTAYFVYRVAEQYKIKNKDLTVLFFGLQPLYFQLAFRCYAEILGALGLILMLYFWNKDKMWVVALISSYLFAVRQEFVIISLLLGGFFVYKGYWKEFLILGWMPVLLAVLGWIHSGDMLWLVNSFLGGGENTGFSKPGFWNYWVKSPEIFGWIIAGLFIVGFTQYKKYPILTIAFLSLFLFSCILASPELNISKGQGITRYILIISPVIALFAGIGFNKIMEKL